MLIFGLLVYVVLPELLSLSVLRRREFPQAQGLLVRGGGVIPYGWWDYVGWTVAVAISSPSVPPDFPGVSWWEGAQHCGPETLCGWILFARAVAAGILREGKKHFRPWIKPFPELAVSVFDAACPCLHPSTILYSLPVRGVSQAHRTWRHQSRPCYPRCRRFSVAGPNWCPPVSPCPWVGCGSLRLVEWDTTS